MYEVFLVLQRRRDGTFPSPVKDMYALSDCYYTHYKQIMEPTLKDTCVYTHSRLDGTVFYVGIGSPNRPHSERNCNQHWHNIVQKYGGYSINILHQNLTWEQACAIEIELIKKYREISGAKLCNLTAGGDGSKGLVHSPESRAKRSAVLKGRLISEEHRLKIGVALKGRVFSEEARERMSASQKARPPMSEETRSKMSAFRKGKVRSPETRAKMAEANRNRPPISEETRAKLSAARKLVLNRAPELKSP